MRAAHVGRRHVSCMLTAVPRARGPTCRAPTDRSSTKVFRMIHPHRTPARTLLKLLAPLAASLAAAATLAAPSVQQVSGPLDHNATITITGSGFGAKPTSAPILWDNATGKKMS